MALKKCRPIYVINKPLRGTAPRDLIFEDFVHIFCAYFLKKIKQLLTKYPMDLSRNVPRNPKITVLF